jgi:hypothetical protein
LRKRLEQVPVSAGKISHTWDSLFQPDERMQKRQAAIELALIEHSRLVNAAKKLVRSRRKKGGAQSSRD